MRNPNIFAYMKAAGFATFLVDAQHGFGRPPNFMTDADVESLDEHVLVRNTVADFEEWNADRLILPELARIIRTHERSFTYVLKIGAHFPYSVRFPPERAWFRASDLAADYEGARKAIISEYLNTIRFAVDEFASELVTTLAALERDVIVIYTADHGQSLFEPWGEDGRRIRGHGHSKDPPPYQARIPLLVLAIGEGARAAMSAHYDESLRDRASAFELFPTLLRVAGYAKTDVSEHYSHTLFDSDADRSGRVFISGNHFGADGPLYREAPYRSSFGLHAYATPTDAP